ncbi:MAG: hypothetical protein E6K11_11140 [Methanobacteriota archaeon]|nr:MAG: hypothetical protein E6K11_11140 [Euryarchaeota archaeon]
MYPRDGGGNGPDSRRLPLRAGVPIEGSRTDPCGAAERPPHRSGRHAPPRRPGGVPARLPEGPSVRPGAQRRSIPRPTGPAGGHRLVPRGPRRPGGAHPRGHGGRRPRPDRRGNCDAALPPPRRWRRRGDPAPASPPTRVRPDSDAPQVPGHKSQVDIVIGAPGVPRRHEDYYALNLANLLFGRIGLYGRLGRNLRDEQGLAYYAFSNLDARTAGGIWTISAGVNPSNLGKAIESIRAEMDRLRTEPFSLEEVRDGKENQTGSLVVSLERNAEVAGELHRMEYYGLGMDFLERYADIVRELTEERVRNLARKYLLPSASSIAVAGPIGRLRVPW